MKKNHIVILDRSTQTLIVRGLMLGMQEEQLTKGLLWWRNSIYKELFDKGYKSASNVKESDSKSLSKDFQKEDFLKIFLPRKKVIIQKEHFSLLTSSIISSIPQKGKK